MKSDERGMLLTTIVKESTVEIVFDTKQLKQIGLGFINGLSLEQIQIYANPAFTPAQMKQIGLGFKDGLTKEQVVAYANPKIDSLKMSKLRVAMKKLQLNKWR